MKTEKVENVVKKKKIIITLLILLIVLVMVIGVIFGIFIYKKIKINLEPQNGKVNTLYIDEEVKRWGGKRFDGWVRK